MYFFKSVIEMPFDWDNGGEKVQILDVIQFDNTVLIYQQTYSIAESNFQQIILN